MIRVRRNLESLEARLESPVPTPGRPKGKAERDRYQGGEELEVRFSGVPVSDGWSVEILVEDRVLGSVRVERDGRGCFKMSTAQGDTVPVVQIGDRVSVRYEGVVLLEGTFYVD